MINRNIRTVIVEDEPEALELFIVLLEATGLAEVTASTTNPFDAFELVTKHNPDILFLDIKMPGMSGFDILNDLKEKSSIKPHVVFTTAHDEYAIKAFEYAAFDYLLKPVDPDRLKETLHRFNASGKNDFAASISKLSEEEKFLIFRGVTGAVFVDPGEVVFITADGNYSTFHFSSGRTETVTSQLGTIEEKLGERFYRAGRSCIINTACLARVDTRLMQCVLVKRGREFRCEISRDKIRQLLDHMKTRIIDV
jgi:two-component system LytT family response regulator